MMSFSRVARRFTRHAGHRTAAQSAGTKPQRRLLSDARTGFVIGLAMVCQTFLSVCKSSEPEPAGSPEAPRVLIVVGPSSHPPGTHEVAAGGRLMAYSLENSTNLTAIPTTVTTAWPHDTELQRGIDTVVFIGDEFPPHKLPRSAEILADLDEMMGRGCGIVCIHFATGLREPDVTADGEHPLLHWMGGYFASRCSHHKSIARIFADAEVTPATVDHPVARGWQTFQLTDEPYIENYFGPPGHAERVGLIEFATAMLPPESPRRQVVAWGIERGDGGRGFGIVMPHYYRNWGLDDLRTLILNGIVWTAGDEIPDDGVRVEIPDLSRFDPAESRR